MQGASPIVTRLSKAVYLAALHQEGAALVVAARRGLAAPVPSCPGWTVASLVAHTGRVHRRVSRWVRLRVQEAVPVDYPDLATDPAMVAWLRQGATDLAAMPATVLEWFEEGVADLEAVLRDTDPDEPVYTWFPPEQRAGFWHRRMAQETAVHRWDAQLAYTCTEPIEATLARDGVDEVLDVFLHRNRPRSKLAGSGETYHFHLTDGPGEWTVRFEGASAELRREHGKGDVAVRGAASDLLLFLWQRIPADRLEVLGDARLLDRYFELVPPI